MGQKRRWLSSFISKNKVAEFLGSPYTSIAAGYITEGSYWKSILTNNSIASGTKGDDFDNCLTLWGYSGSFMDKLDNWSKDIIGSSMGLTERLNTIANNFQGLTFFKNFSTDTKNGLSANFSVGSPTATFTASRDATHPATYVDADGVIQLVTTSNIPRYQSGYYDATGFHAQKGLMIEGASANLIPKASVIDDATWTETDSTADNADAGSPSPDGTATAPSLTATAGNGNLLLTTAVTAQTFSVWLKRKTGTGTINITANGGTTWTAVTVTSEWCRFQETKASASQKCGIQIVTDTDAVYVWGCQFEDLPYATSFIPTTTAALTRNAEVLKYAIAGNRTAAQESLVFKYANWGVENIPAIANLSFSDTDTKRRYISLNGDSDRFLAAPNLSDNGSVVKTSGTSPTVNISNTDSAVFKHESPFIQLYLNGVANNAYTTGDWTDPAWGTYFYIGCNNASTSQFQGIIQSVAFFNRALSATEVLAVSNLLNGS